MASRLGSRITFVQQDPVDFLSSKSEEPIFDVAVLAHCIWYFSSPSVLANIFQVLAKRVKFVCVAEYALAARTMEQLPHVLAVLARVSLEVFKPVSESNVRTILSMKQIQSLAEGAGMSALPHFKVFEPAIELSDGRWEVGTVLDEEFEEEVKVAPGPRERAAILAQREAVLQAVSKVGGLKKVRTMDVFCQCFRGVDV